MNFWELLKKVIYFCNGLMLRLDVIPNTGIGILILAIWIYRLYQLFHCTGSPKLTSGLEGIMD